ncbi:hypothetical protein HYX10_03230 [Candidatus Woesearchaeota archaeon]|nr:hypothetical protein [Candidatus Woesearchaeota archaeon]
MNKKIISLILLSFMFTVVLSNIAYAQPTGIPEWFSEDQDWPPYGTGETDPIPRWYIAIVWLALGTIIFVTASKVPPFKETAHKNAMIFFAFAFSGIAVGGTAFVNYVASLFGVGAVGFWVVGIIALVSLLIGLLPGSLGLGAKVGGEGFKLGAEGVEAGKDAIRSIKGEKRDEQMQQRLLSQLEQMETAGIRDVNALTNYLHEINRILANPTALKNKNLRQSLSDKISALNPAIHALRLDTSGLERVTRAMESVSRQEVNLLKREMRTARAAAAGAGGPAPTDAQINTYLNDLRTQVLTDYRSERDMANLKTRLDTASAQLSTDLHAAVTQLNAGNIAAAQTQFGNALHQLQIIGSELAELERIGEGIEARIQAETRGINALDHLARIHI